MAGSVYVARFPDALVGAFPITVAGWLRLEQSPLAAGETIFTACNADRSFAASLAIGVDGLLVGSAAMTLPGGGSTCVTSIAKIPIADTVWRYVAMAVDQNTVLALYVDGLRVDVESAASSVAQGVGEAFPADLQVGVFLNPIAETEASGLAFVSWSIWKAALTAVELIQLNYASPAATSPEGPGLAIAVNFADGLAKDTSGNNVSFNTITPTFLTPSLVIQPGGGAEVIYQPVPIAAPGAFSLVTWIARTGQPDMSIVSCSAAPQSFVVSISGETMTIKRTGQNGGVPIRYDFTASVPEKGWIHLAVVTDEDEIRLYINGALRQSFECQNSVEWAGPITGPVFFGQVSGAAPESGALQGITLWRQCIGLQQIQGLMNGDDPAPSGNAEAFFPLLEDTKDEVYSSEFSLALTNAAITDDAGFVVGDPDVPGSRYAKSAEIRADAVSAPVAPDGPMILNSEALKSAAEQHAASIPENVSRDTLSDDLASAIDWYEEILADLPEETAAPLRANFLRNLHLGEAKVRAGDRTGTFDVEFGDGRTIISYHDLDGKHEVHVIDEALSARAAAIIKIVLNSFALLFAVFGVYAAASAMSRAVESWFGNVVDGIIWAVSWKTSTTVQVVGQIVRWIYAAGRLPGFIKACITGMSFWSRLFTVLSFVAQVLLIWASGGAALAAKIGLLGFSIGQLAADIKVFNDLPPDPDATEKPETALTSGET